MDCVRAILAFFLTLLLANAHAAIDPVAWSVNPAGFPPNTVAGNSYSVTYTFTNNLPRPVPFDVTAVFDGGLFNMSNGCKTTLAGKNQPNSSCLVHLQFQPNGPGLNTAKLIMHYHNNVVPLPTLSSISSEQTGPIEGVVTVPLPSETYTGSDYDVVFTYMNHSAAAITATSVNVSGFTPTTNGCLAPIAANGNCTVTGTFAPVTIGQTSLSVTYNYTEGGASLSVPLTTQTLVKNGAGCHQVTASAVLPLPDKTFIYADNVVKYKFTNECPSTESLGTVSITADGAATLTAGTSAAGTDTCSNTTLAQNNSCFVYVSVVPTATTADLTVTAKLPYQGGTLSASASTSEEVMAIPSQTSTHTVMFVNQCDFPVWYEFENGAPPTADPTPPGGSYQLNEQQPNDAPSTLTLSVNQYLNGAIYVRTGCDVNTGVCATGTCPSISPADPMRCALNTQPANFPPLTKMELNMEPASVVGTDGVYDVSMVNGFNVPAEVRSLAPVLTSTPPNNAPYPFNCGQSAGALIQPQPLPGQPSSTQLGACPWTFSPPNTGSPDIPPNYTAVVGGAADACVDNSGCASGTYCGMGFDGAQWQRRCAPFLGYTNVLTYTGYSAAGQWGAINLYTAFGLGTDLPLSPPEPSPGYGNSGVTGLPATYTDMWGCTPTSTGALQSGYAYTFLVCGCYNWTNTAQVSPCLADNPDWEAAVKPRITWLKNACPTAYSYNHDDASTSFTCNQAGKQTSYQITFCPGGKTGKPGG